MSFKSKRIIMIVASLLAFALSQVFVGFAAPISGVVPSPVTVQSVSGVLATTANKPIAVNGQTALPGATIMSGSTIETPDQVKATIIFPGRAAVAAEANTRFIVTFDQNSIKVHLIQGCVVLFTRVGTSGEIDDQHRVVAKSDGVNESRLDLCPTGIAGATVAAAGGGGLFGMGAAATVAVVGGSVAATTAIMVARSSNPSPSSF